MDIPNLNCKWCEYQTELRREHCSECLFSLENLFKEKTWKQLTKEDVDHHVCDSCNFKNMIEKCQDCIYLELKK